MGLLDSVQGMMSSATSSASRSVELAKLNSRVKEINQERTRLASQLGAALYERIKEESEIGGGFEVLCKSIAELDKERDEVSRQIAQIEQANKVRTEAKQVYECPNCKSAFSSADVFCSGCGKRVDELLNSIATAGEAAVTGDSFCANCGAEVDAEDVFCMSCGSKLSEVIASENSGEGAVFAVRCLETEDKEVSLVNENEDIANDAQQSVCPQCGCELQANDRFCMGCGAKIS